MDISILKEFFMWMTVLNVALMLFQSFLCMALKNVIGRMHGSMFGITPEAIKVAIYGYLGVYKVCFIIFCLTPWLALEIIS